MPVRKHLTISGAVARCILAVSCMLPITGAACAANEKFTAPLVHIYANDSMGSGVILDNRGYIITSYHLVSGSKSISVVLKSGEQYVGTLVCRNEGRNFAIVRIGGFNGELPAALPGNSDAVLQGDPVSVAGYQQDKSAPEITAGTVSGIVKEDGVTYLRLSINTAGKQGSPVFTKAGEVAGIVIWDAGDATRSGLAVAVNEIKDSFAASTCSDCNALNLSGVSVKSVTDTSAVIAWQTDKPATGIVEYGPQGSFLSKTDIKSELGKSHAVVVKGLKGNSSYQYRAISADSCGNEAFSEILPLKTSVIGPGTEALSIINVTVTEISSSGVTVNWVTNKPANTVIFYGTSETDKNNTRTDSKNVYEHSIRFEGLTPETRYYLDVQSVSEKAEVAKVSATPFKTASTSPLCCRLACKMPDFDYKDMNGNDFTQDDIAGKKVIMTFVKTTCSICMGQAVYLNDIYQTWPKGDITFMAVANREKPEDINEWMKKYGLTVPIYNDIEGNLVNYCHLRTIPSTLCINEKGIICYEKEGPFGSKKEFEGAMQSVKWK